MRKNISMFVIVSLIIGSPAFISCANAKALAAVPVSDYETCVLAAAEANTSRQIDNISGGEANTGVTVLAVIGVLALIGVVIAANADDSSD